MLVPGFKTTVMALTRSSFLSFCLFDLTVERDENENNYVGSWFQNHGDVTDDVIVLIFLQMCEWIIYAVSDTLLNVSCLISFLKKSREERVVVKSSRELVLTPLNNYYKIEKI